MFRSVKLGFRAERISVPDCVWVSRDRDVAAAYKSSQQICRITVSKNHS